MVYVVEDRRVCILWKAGAVSLVVSQILVDSPLKVGLEMPRAIVGERAAVHYGPVRGPRVAAELLGDLA